MDTTLIINTGSSSKKYALYRESVVVFSAEYEHTGKGLGRCVEQNGTRLCCDEVPERQFADALLDVIRLALAERIILKKEDINRVGIRIVAPGTYFTTHRLVDDMYQVRLREACVFAPLHIPHQLAELEGVRIHLPHARIIGISDSAFHVTLAASAHRYSVSSAESQRIDLYRFGYHGLSIASVVRQVYEKTGAIPLRTVVCHVGSGVSVTALRDGKSIDTTMGFAPTSGLIMGTRAGDIDPSALLYLLKMNDNNIECVEQMLEVNGGLKGLLGTSDLRVALDREARGEREAQYAVKMFFTAIRKAIGAMTALLGGIDALVLTATAVERNPYVRARICNDFAYLGICIDAIKNEECMARPGIISTDDSSVPVYVMHTREMSEMARIASVF